MQQQAQQPQNNLTPQETQNYNRMRQEYADVFRVFLDIEDERKEHGLVIDAVKNIDDGRRCWRLVGGILVERKLGEVVTSLKENIELLEKTATNYNQVMKNKYHFVHITQREKDLMEFEMKNNLRPSQQSQTQQQSIQQKNTGVLT